MLLKSFIYLIAFLKKDFVVQFRKDLGIVGFLFYLISFALIYSLVLDKNLSSKLQNIFFWTLEIFTLFLLITKSIFSESEKRFALYYFMISSKFYLWSKLLFNIIISMFLSLINILLLIYFLHFTDIVFLPFFLIQLIPTTCLVCILSFYSTLAIKAKIQSTIFFITSLPLLIPSLLLSIQITQYSIDKVPFSMWSNYLWGIITFSVFVILLSTLLFDYLWKNN